MEHILLRGKVTDPDIYIDPYRNAAASGITTALAVCAGYLHDNHGR
ncbi:hypothetical protein EDC45_0569 [Mesocricetibacter intestinalis]|uniref:Uncharacterized protein n=1 Tax=Mesocricetibacter intestinalis TaxID=1521930 RepID=A0A4R6VG94_9PAST|nr:hypothetical protein EDC45_0569 [Mesocricetibacter intestinalis]